MSKDSAASTGITGWIDTDGDGYGWNGVATCVIPDRQTHDCESRGDDQWSWNPITQTLCQLEERVTSSVLNSNSDSSECVDTDGDEYGWNGFTSCQVPITATTECIDIKPSDESECPLSCDATEFRTMSKTSGYWSGLVKV